jgi:hypothetical protein
MDYSISKSLQQYGKWEMGRRITKNCFKALLSTLQQLKCFTALIKGR